MVLASFEHQEDNKFAAVRYAREACNTLAPFCAIEMEVHESAGALGGAVRR
jgi:hypothetical protein